MLEPSSFLASAKDRGVTDVMIRQAEAAFSRVQELMTASQQQADPEAGEAGTSSICHVP